MYVCMYVCTRTVNIRFKEKIKLHYISIIIVEIKS